MDGRFNIDTAVGLVRVVVSGPFSIQDHAGLTKRIIEHPDFRANMDFLIDARSLDMNQTRAQDIRATGEHLATVRGRMGHGKLAWVAGDNVGFGLARMFEIMHESGRLMQMVVFRDAEEAERWVMGGAELPTLTERQVVPPHAVTQPGRAWRDGRTTPPEVALNHG